MTSDKFTQFLQGVSIFIYVKSEIIIQKIKLTGNKTHMFNFKHIYSDEQNALI